MPQMAPFCWLKMYCFAWVVFVSFSLGWMVLSPPVIIESSINLSNSSWGW